jgi:hypothetical protein
MTDTSGFGRYDIESSTRVSRSRSSRTRRAAGDLHIYYPPVTIWSDHPIVMLNAPWVTAAQDRGRAVDRYLRSWRAQSL